MKLTGFDLIDGGRKGLVIYYDEQKKGDRFSALDSVKRTCRVPAPMTLRHEILKLKHYFLTATGYWKPSWTKFLREDLLGIDDDALTPEKDAPEKAKAHELLLNTTIDGVKVKNKGIFIAGTVTINDKCITPKYDYVAPDDEYGIYDEIFERMEIVSEIIFDYMDAEDLKLADVKQILSEMVRTEADKERVKMLSDQESLDEMISLLEEKGCIVIEPDGGVLKEIKKNPDEESQEISLAELKGMENKKMDVKEDSIASTSPEEENAETVYESSEESW